MTCTCSDRPLVSIGCLCAPDAPAVSALTRVRRLFLAERNANRYLYTVNDRLGGIPAQLILAGRGDDVVADAALVVAQ